MKCPKCMGSGREWGSVMTTAAFLGEPIPCILCMGTGKLSKEELEARQGIIMAESLDKATAQIEQLGGAIQEMRFWMEK